MSATEQNKQRGTILRDTTQGEGLISIQGKQYAFDLQKHWRSDLPPSPGAKVDVWLDTHGVIELKLVPESELAKELAAETTQKLQEASGRWFKLALQKLGKIPLLAMTGLFIGWVMLDQVSFNAFGQSKGLDIWQVLRMLHTGGSLEDGLSGYANNAGIGLWGYLFVISMVAPFSVMFTNARKAQLTLALPLTLIVLSAVRIVWSVTSAMREMQEKTNGMFGRDAERMMQKMSSNIMDAVLQNMSLEAGLYLSIVSACVLAFYGWLRFGTSR